MGVWVTTVKYLS